MSALLFFKDWLGRPPSQANHWKASPYCLLPPLSFAFIHLAFAYHMISLIVRIIGVLNPSLMLVVTIIVCGVFFLAYILVLP